MLPCNNIGNYINNKNKSVVQLVQKIKFWYVQILVFKVFILVNNLSFIYYLFSEMLTQIDLHRFLRIINSPIELYLVYHWYAFNHGFGYPLYFLLVLNASTNKIWQVP